MRNLHVVAPNEVFVASGTYRYWRDNVELGISEQFTIHELQGGAFLYRVDEDGRDEDGLTILSEALISPDYQFDRFNVQSYNAKDQLLKTFKADYTFNPNYVQIGRQMQGADREYDEFELLHDSQIYIKQTLYMGLTIRNIMDVDGSSQVFAPQLLSVDDNLLQKIIVKHMDTEALIIGKRTIETRKFQIADDVFYWLDQHDIPLQRQYTHNGAQYLVKVTNYAHR
ncbi:MAG: hypothetical protein WBC91_22685 [Phototrophicaceae bacterium]